MAVRRILNWEINSINQERQEIWRSVDDGEAILIATLDPDVTTYTDTEEVPLKLSVSYNIVSAAVVKGNEVKQAAPINYVPVFGSWKKPTVTPVGNGVYRYISTKTNHYSMYDSYADFDLETALVRSFQDVDMQQWQAVNDAVAQLAGTTNWVFDPASKRINYQKRICDDGSQDCGTLTLYQANWSVNQTDWHYTNDGACRKTAEIMSEATGGDWRFSDRYYTGSCIMHRYEGSSIEGEVYVSTVTKPNPDPTPPGDAFLNLDAVAQKIVSNVTSSNAGVALLAETFMGMIANSINHQDPAKRFVNIDDLVDGLETNKVVRT